MVVRAQRAAWSLQRRPRIAGLTRVRNEAHIIHETLNHHAALCDAGIYVYDDCSTDDTALICRAHPAVIDVVEGVSWNPDRLDAEYQGRQAVLERALLDEPDWLLYFDADERVEVDLSRVPFSRCDGVAMRLFDFYITEADVDTHYADREWMGPEYRRILMMFRNMRGIGYSHPDQRECTLPAHARVCEIGDVRHYGKAISVDEWEATCRYYADHFPEPYRSKWRARMGKAVHVESDFGRPLVRWEDRDRLGLELPS
ncbi:MAG: glycosyltransferase family 2 protein [Coriobacteriia bacterium]|nr:glycosyltransferase family 2 protein [Coriobacteriia bacterium]